jgi:hypothetical protein
LTLENTGSTNLLINEFYKDKAKKDGYREKCKNCESIKKKTYYQENKEKRNEYESTKYHSDEATKIKKLLRRRILACLKTKTSNAILEICGCELDFFKKWIEFQYKLLTNNNTIDWEDFKTNYHIENFLSCSSFDLTNIEEQKKCFNWKNIQISVKKGSNIIMSKELEEKHDKNIKNFLNLQ